MLFIYPPEAWDITLFSSNRDKIGYLYLNGETLDDYTQIIARIDLSKQMTVISIKNEGGKIHIPEFNKDGLYWLNRSFYHSNRDDKSPEINKIKEYTINICKEYLNCKIVNSREDILKYKLLL